MATYVFVVWWNQQSHARFVSLQRNACSITSTFWVDACNIKYTLGPKPASNPWALSLNFTPVDGDTLSIQTSGSSSPFNQFGQIREDGSVIGSTAASVQRTTPLVYFRWQNTWHEFKERSYTELEDWMESIRNPDLPHINPLRISLKVPDRNTALIINTDNPTRHMTLNTNDSKRQLALKVPDRKKPITLQALGNDTGGIS